jgi:hypothetical protein
MTFEPFPKSSVLVCVRLHLFGHRLHTHIPTPPSFNLHNASTHAACLCVCLWQTIWSTFLSNRSRLPSSYYRRNEDTPQGHSKFICTFIHAFLRCFPVLCVCRSNVRKEKRFFSVARTSRSSFSASSSKGQTFAIDLEANRFDCR